MRMVFIQKLSVASVEQHLSLCVIMLDVTLLPKRFGSTRRVKLVVRRVLQIETQVKRNVRSNVATTICFAIQTRKLEVEQSIEVFVILKEKKTH